MGDGFSVIPFLLNSAQQLILRYHKLISTAEEELERLSQDIGLLKADVKDALTVANKSEHLIVWLRQVRDLIFDVEDTMAYSVAQAAKEKNSYFIYRMCNKTKIDLAAKVESWRAMVKDKRGEAAGLFDNLPKSLPKLNREESTNLNLLKEKDPRHENVIHLKLEMDQIVQDLMATSEGLKSFSIAGMHGIGKTTLAWNIHKDPRIIREFPTIIWVKVTQEFKTRTACLTILEKFGKELTDKTEDSELSKMVCECLGRGKFLVVFDDVWKTGHWDDIDALLPRENNQGRVLITTRISEVARYATSKEPNRLRFLKEKESWELLQLEVFGNLDDCPTELREIGKQIALQCKGLPIAIVVMGGLLKDILRKKLLSKEWMEEWTKISLQKRRKKEILTEIISLSYDFLSPDALKDCFLYLGTFPEDSEIPVWKLTQLWIAEGFIPEEEGATTLEDTAQEYLQDLIDKNLLMVEKRKPSGQVKTCRVHDTIRDFCKKEGADLFQEISYSEQKNCFEPDHVQCRRICVHSRVKEFLSGNRDFKKVRSFLSFPSEAFTVEKGQVPSITEVFTYLRVLDVNKAINFSRFPANLTRLVLLKYVTLSSEEFKVLPKDIYKLWNVQTLEVYTSSPTLKIKASIWKMMNLQHFKTKASIILTKDKKGKCSDTLRTLNRLSPQSCTEKVFNRAKKLKALGVLGNLEKLSDPGSCFKKLEHLEKLKLVHQVSSEEEGKRKPLQVVPVFPSNLTTLKLSGIYLEREHMITIGELRALKVLKLQNNVFVGDIWDAGHFGFGSLVSLHISDTDLSLWAASGEAFPVLKDLVLKNCKKLKEVPRNLVMRLELLHMDDVGHHAVSSAREIEKEIQKKRRQDQRISELKLVVVSSPVSSQ